jgi:hypothetical protein
MLSFIFVIIEKHCLQVVGTANQPHLARQLIEFLMGETDGVPKAGLEKTRVFFLNLFQREKFELFLLKIKKKNTFLVLFLVGFLGFFGWVFWVGFFDGFFIANPGRRTPSTCSGSTWPGSSTRRPPRPPSSLPGRSRQPAIIGLCKKFFLLYSLASLTILRRTTV